MKLTKRQQDVIHKMINENLQDVLHGRMTEASIDGDMVGRVDTNVIVDAIKNDPTVLDFIHSRVADLLFDVAYKVMPTVFTRICKKHAVNTSISPADVKSIIYDNDQQFQEMHLMATDDIAEQVMNLWVVELTNSIIMMSGIDSPEDTEV